MIRSVVRSLVASVVLVGAAAFPALADDTKALNADVLAIAKSWAHIKFEERDTTQQQRDIAALTEQAKALVQKYPNRAEAIIWEGILLSEGASMASEANSLLTARSLAYRARDILLEAEKIDSVALEAGAPTSLGVLYYRVPSFPIAFGDAEKARHYLEQAVRNAPDGLDANYFYGDFLMQQHEYAHATRVWQHALSLPPSSDRPLWDKSRRLVIQQNLAKLAKGHS